MSSLEREITYAGDIGGGSAEPTESAKSPYLASMYRETSRGEVVTRPRLEKPGRRMTQKDLARYVGLSQSTVSMCFANSSRLPLETRRKVQAAAEAIGYRPDPMLQSLAIYRGNNREKRFQAVLGWLTPYQPETVRPGTFHYEALAGARVQAERLGYAIDPIWVKAPGMTGRRVDSMLKARGIQGILLPPRDQTVAHTNLKCAWDSYAALALGDYTVARPWVDLVATDHFRAMEVTLRHLKRLGFKRIGFINEDNLDRRLLRGYSSALMAVSEFSEDAIRREMHTVNISVHLEISGEHVRQLGTWLKSFRPDVLIYTDVKKRNVILSALEPARIQLPPHEFLLCLPPRTANAEPLSGIDEDWSGVGAHAVELLVARLQQGKLGLPERPQRVLVEGIWRHAREHQLRGPGCSSTLHHRMLESLSAA